MNPHLYTKFNIAGLGEILWDCFPEGHRLGGAPTNFACHCDQLGANAFPISSVGNDNLGRETLNELSQRDIDATYITQTLNHPTSRVLVTLNEFGKPNYEIIKNVAWDHLTLTPELKSLAPSLDAVCFGSLSQRSHESRSTIQAFLKLMPENSLKIFDVNLRNPYYTKEVIIESLQLASILKLSDDELPILARYFNLAGTPTEQLHILRKQFRLRLIAYTQGAKGSTLLTKTVIDESPAVKTEVVDSVGAGDSYTAALCVGLLNGWELKRVNSYANEIAAYVCAQKGATPVLPIELKRKEVYS